MLSDGGDVLEDPIVALLGVPESDAEGAAFRKIVEEAVDDALDALPKPRRRDAEVVREAVQARGAQRDRHGLGKEAADDRARGACERLAINYKNHTTIFTKYQLLTYNKLL